MTAADVRRADLLTRARLLRELARDALRRARDLEREARAGKRRTR